MSNQTYANLRLGASLSFDGTATNGVKVPVVSAATDNFSMGVWAKITTASSGIYTLMSNGINDTVTNFNGFALQIAAGQFRLNFNGVTGVSTGITAPAAGVWFHAVVVRNSGNMHFYVNGQDTGFVTSQAPTTPTGFTTIAGTTDATGSTYFRNHVGLLSQAFFYGRALSGTEVTTLYNGGSVTGSVLWWQLNEGGGALAHDLSGNGNNGQITGATFVRDAPPAPKLARSGTTRSAAGIDTGRSLGLRGGTSLDNVTIPSITPGSSYSIGMWFKMNAASSSQRFLSYRSITTGSFGGIELIENGTTNKMTLVGYDATGTLVVNIASATTFTMNAWHHVAITIAPNNTTLYLDGTSIGTDTTHTIAAPSGQTFTIGRASFTPGSAFIGQVDQFIFGNNTVWSSATVSALYNSGTVPSGATCVLNFDERSGPLAIDATGNANNGSVNALTSSYGRLTDVPPHQPTYGRTATYP